jgi:hypothetical protein
MVNTKRIFIRDTGFMMENLTFGTLRLSVKAYNPNDHDEVSDTAYRVTILYRKLQEVLR